MPPTALRARGSSEVPFVFFISSPLTALGGVTLTALVGTSGWFLLVWLAAPRCRMSRRTSRSQPIAGYPDQSPWRRSVHRALWRLVAATGDVCRWIEKGSSRSHDVELYAEYLAQIGCRSRTDPPRSLRGYGLPGPDISAPDVLAYHADQIADPGVRAERSGPSWITLSRLASQPRSSR